MAGKQFGVDIDMDSNQIKNLAAPSLSTDAIPRGYVDNTPYRAVTAATSVVASDANGTVNCTANTFTVTLPSAVTVGSGFKVDIKNSGAGVITIATTAAQTIDGVTTRTLSPLTIIQVTSNGANWIIRSMSVGGTLQATPVDPVVTASLVGVMMGLAGSFTPTKSGNVMLVITGDTDNTTNVRGTAIQIRTGTGAAPANGAALTGTARGSLVNSLGASTTNRFPFACSAVITGLTIGIAIWIDISLAVTGGSGSARARNISISLIEQ